jgi:hypothetical protein
MIETFLLLSRGTTFLNENSVLFHTIWLGRNIEYLGCNVSASVGDGLEKPKVNTITLKVSAGLARVEGTKGSIRKQKRSKFTNVYLVFYTTKGRDYIISLLSIVRRKPDEDVDSVIGHTKQRMLPKDEA